MNTLILCIALCFSAAFCMDHMVRQVGTTWVPNCIEANVGDTVTAMFAPQFHNFVQVPSNISVAFNGTGFESGEVGAANNMSPFTTPPFMNVGTYYFICEAHVRIGMRGWIYVRAMGDNTPKCNSSSNGPYFN